MLDVVHRQAVRLDVLDVAARFVIPDNLPPHAGVLLRPTSL
jgi:hypothetical protein